MVVCSTATKVKAFIGNCISIVYAEIMTWPWPKILNKQIETKRKTTTSRNMLPFTFWWERNPTLYQSNYYSYGGMSTDCIIPMRALWSLYSHGSLWLHRISIMTGPNAIVSFYFSECDAISCWKWLQHKSITFGIDYKPSSCSKTCFIEIKAWIFKYFVCFVWEVLINSRPTFQPNYYIDNYIPYLAMCYYHPFSKFIGGWPKPPFTIRHGCWVASNTFV